MDEMTTLQKSTSEMQSNIGKLVGKRLKSYYVPILAVSKSDFKTDSSTLKIRFVTVYIF